MLPNELDVSLVSELLRVWRLLPDQTETRNAPAFLVDRNDRLDRAQVAQIVDELSELRCVREIASEENVCPRLDASKQTSCFRIKFFSGNTGHYQLTNGIGLHGAQR